MVAEVVALPHALVCALACGVIAHWLLILLVLLSPIAFIVCALRLLVLSLLIGIALVILVVARCSLALALAKSLSVVCPGHPHVGKALGKKNGQELIGCVSRTPTRW